MHCAEKAPEHFMLSVSNDMYRLVTWTFRHYWIIDKTFVSPSEDTRRQALVRLSTFFSRRFQLLSQTFIPDKAHRRPFKPSRTVMSFVATDIGSNSHVHEEDNDTQNKRGLPSDLKQKLSEIGWADDEKPMDRQRQMERTPMSLLSGVQLDSLLKEKDTQDTMVTASNSSPNQTDLLRRNSSTGSHIQSTKRRPVFVQPLASIFAHFAALLSDNDVAVAEITRQICLDFMRTDPATICRHSMDTLSESQGHVHGSILILSQMLHGSKTLPPAFSYYLFNHLTGFLKTRAREANSAETLQEFAEVLPILAKVVAQVSDVSIKDFRRAKVEALLFPSGSLWFSDAAPTGPMFPRDDVKNPFEGVSSQLVCICQIRTSQNLLLLRMLQRNPQDVNIVRKNLTTFALPAAGDKLDERTLEITDFVPSRASQKARATHEVGTLDMISATLSRSYLLLISQIFRCMTRHLSDRNELANLMEGVNRVLLRHCNDLSIVGHALIGD